MGFRSKKRNTNKKSINSKKQKQKQRHSRRRTRRSKKLQRGGGLIKDIKEMAKTYYNQIPEEPFDDLQNANDYISNSEFMRIFVELFEEMPSPALHQCVSTVFGFADIDYIYGFNEYMIQKGTPVDINPDDADFDGMTKNTMARLLAYYIMLTPIYIDTFDSEFMFSSHISANFEWENMRDEERENENENGLK